MSVTTYPTVKEFHFISHLPKHWIPLASSNARSGTSSAAAKPAATAEKPQQKSLVSGSAFIRDTFTREFFAERQGWGDARGGPIFIVGMHRAGSTLVEQILSSHSQIEGSEELYIITKFSSELVRNHPEQDHAAIVNALGNEEFKLLAERYFEISSRSRQTQRPYLTDKYPGNWKFVGLIHCMLPNARIIDVRRNPMDCCFANYFRYYGTVGAP